MSPGLLLAVEMLRRELPEGAEILALAGTRARHRAVVRTGRVFDLGLASWTLAQPHCDYAEQVDVALAIRRGLVLGEALRDAAPSAILIADDAEDAAISQCSRRPRGPLQILTPTGLERGIDALCRAFGVRSAGATPALVKGVACIATLEKSFFARADLPDMVPVGMLYVGGADAVEVRAEVRDLRALLAERTLVQ